MKKPSFKNADHPLITAMIQCRTPEECADKIERSLAAGAEAFGIQLCQLSRQYRTKEVLTDLFSRCGGKPIYITSYRYNESTGMTDEECADLLLLGLSCGATLCDIMGDLFAPNEYQITDDPEAVARQKELIRTIHARGGEVLISTHDFRPLTADKIFAVAAEQKARGADVLKIVVQDSGLSQLPAYLAVLQKMAKTLDRKILFLSVGPCGKYLRRLGADFGACCYLCVSDHGELDTPSQPTIQNILDVKKVFA